MFVNREKSFQIALQYEGPIQVKSLKELNG